MCYAKGPTTYKLSFRSKGFVDVHTVQAQVIVSDSDPCKVQYNTAPRVAVQITEAHPHFGQAFNQEFTDQNAFEKLQRGT